MAVQKFTPVSTEVDLEATAELPAVDFDSMGADVASSTDVHVAPAIPAGVAELAISLREAELRLTRKMERVAGLEAELATALRTAVELRAQLDQETARAAARETALREAELQLGRNLERVAGLEGELAKVQRAAEELRAQLDRETTLGASRETTLRAAELQLARNLERVARLEADLVNAQRETADLRVQLDQETARGTGRETALRERAEGLDRQLAGLLQEQLARDASQQRLAGDVAALTRNNERLLEALQTWQGFRGVAEAQLAEQDLRLVQVNAEHAAQVAAVEARNSELQVELGAARIAAEHRVTALEVSLRSAQGARAEGEAALQAQQQLNQQRQAQLDEAVAKTAQLEQDLRVAEEHIHRLESESHSNATLLGSLQQNIERLARDDTASRPVLRVVTTEPAQRVLVREVDGAEVVYPLGRRTTIGRTPDNDIQVDTTFISRHHAVMLSNTDQCVVEDLNSTNGVKVNGRPVNRQALQDGDMVTIGKTEFRYLLRA